MKRINCYVNVTEEEMKIADRIAEKLGYTSRTEILTALVQALIYAEPFRKETRELNSILTAETELSAIRDAFFEILEEYAFPVVAMHGPDYACRVLADDLKAWMYQKCHAVPQDTEMKEWVRLYYSLKKGDIIRYRIAQTTAQFAEEYAEKENEAYA